MSEDEINKLVDAACDELREFIKHGSITARDKAFKKEIVIKYYDIKGEDPKKVAGEDPKKVAKELDGQLSIVDGEFRH